MDYRPLIPRRPLEVRALYSVHYFEYTGFYAFPGERHDFWELLYVDRGAKGLVLRKTKEPIQ